MFNTLTKTTSMVAIFALAACAVPDTPVKLENQPHLAPPAFPVSEAPAGARYCGTRLVGGGADSCLAGEFCRRTIEDQCGAADAPGICSPVPNVCTHQFKPICGCDGQTYSNECTANSNGVSAAYAGRCKP